MATAASYDPPVSADATPLDRDEFEARYALAADAMGALAGPDELDEAWDDYRSGRWALILFDPTPESAVQANRLAGSIAELLDAPAPDDPAWCRRLAARVDQLAVVLREPIDGALGSDPVATSDVDGPAAAGDDVALGSDPEAPLIDDEHPWERWVAAPRRDYPDAIRHPYAEGNDA